MNASNGKIFMASEHAAWMVAKDLVMVMVINSAYTGPLPHYL